MQAAGIRGRPRRHSLRDPLLSEIAQRAGVDLDRSNSESPVQGDDLGGGMHGPQLIDVVEDRLRNSIDDLIRGIGGGHEVIVRSEEHTSELQSLMRNSYAVFFLKNKI